MENDRFDNLTRLIANFTSRRAMLRGAAAGGAVSALGLPAFTGLPGFIDDVEAKKNKKKKRKKRRRKKRRKEKKRKKKCQKNCSSNNPCEDASCNKKGKCKTSNLPNGTDCGNGNICTDGECVSTCGETGSTCEAGAGCCSGVCTCGGNEEAGFCQGAFSQDFAQNTNGWIGVDRVSTGTDGIPAKSGGFFAKVTGPGSDDAGFTRWGGYSSVFPQGGYDTSLAIYIDPGAAEAELQFDYSSAINQPNCDHRRDFIFTAGKNGENYCVSASNNSPGWPCNPERDPETLTETGWYTFNHEFRDVGGVLSVDLVLLDPNGTELNTWTLSDPSDIIGETVGGNRYGWFPNNEFNFVAIDDSARSS